MFVVKCTITRHFTLVNNFLTKNIKFLTFYVFRCQSLSLGGILNTQICIKIHLRKVLLCSEVLWAISLLLSIFFIFN